MLIAVLAFLASESRFEVALTPRAPSPGESLRWSPKGAKVELEAKDGALAGAFRLGPPDYAPVAVRLEKSAGAEHVDLLWLDRDRNGRFDEVERLATTPKETRGKWWSSFQSELPIAVPSDKAVPAPPRPYPLDLWFVFDPQEPGAPPALRWTRRGWHEGEVSIDGKPAFVLVTEMELDGVFDQRDAWMLARERSKLFGANSRGLDGHAWLDGKAYRPVSIDLHGRSLAFERFDPGITEAEEAAKADIYAPDRAAPRAEKPLSFGKDLAAALAQAQKDGKRVLVDFETTWCGPCKSMDQLVYTSKAVVDAAKDVIAIKLDGDEQRELVKQYAVGAYPTILLLASDGKELRRAVGYQSVAKMVEMLKP